MRTVGNAAAGELVAAHEGPALAEARTLMRAYAATLDIDLSFQHFEAELAALPGSFAPPSGRLYLAQLDGQAAGCIALQRIDDRYCEMKRLYVRPASRGHQLGRRLAARLVDDARAIGYAAMRLDTLSTMTEALGLYRSIGFRETIAYRYNPVPDAVYLELALSTG